MGRRTDSNYGPSQPCGLFNRENAWTDASRTLHMRIMKKSGSRSCAEIFLNRSLGCGTYSVTVRDTSHLEPAASFNVFPFRGKAGDQHYREMDVESVAGVTLQLRTMRRM
jgi:hypothetical protein